MSKFNKDDFPLLFAEVAKVLGAEEAEKQLGIAWDGYTHHDEDSYKWEDGEFLIGAFLWRGTPQGFDYWDAIDEETD